MFDGFIDLMFTLSFRAISFICVPQVTLSFVSTFYMCFQVGHNLLVNSS